MLEETHKAPNTAGLKEPSCTPRRKSSWRPGLAELAGPTEEIAQEHPRHSSPPLPWLPSGSPPNTSPSIRTTEKVKNMEPPGPKEAM